MSSEAGMFQLNSLINNIRAVAKVINTSATAPCFFAAVIIALNQNKTVIFYLYLYLNSLGTS